MHHHLKKILSLSINAEKNDILLSNKIETDILMRFAVTLQISNAISSVGIKPSTNFILIALLEIKIILIHYILNYLILV